MNTNTKSKLAFIIKLLKDDLDEAKSELSRLDFVDEGVNPTSNTRSDYVENDNQNAPLVPNGQFGMVKLPIHYTLGRGVSGSLGNEVQEAVFKAFRQVAWGGDGWSINNGEIEFCGVGMSIDMYWDKENRCACLHLELVHTDEHISMDEFGEEIAMPQGRSLN